MPRPRSRRSRANSNLLEGPNNTTLSEQQLGDFNAQLAAARAQKADAEAKAKIIRQMLGSGQPIEYSDILNSELIRRLSEQRVTLRAELAEQSTSLGDQHPRIKELKAQIADLDQQIRAEAESIARSFENDAKIASARVDSLVANFDQIKNQAASTNERDVQLRALERDAKSQRDLLESYLAKYREATARDTSQFRAGRRAGDFAGDGVERAGLSEKTAERADRHGGDDDAVLRFRADQGAVERSRRRLRRRRARQRGARRSPQPRVRRPCRRCRGAPRSLGVRQAVRSPTSPKACADAGAGRIAVLGAVARHGDRPKTSIKFARALAKDARVVLVGSIRKVPRSAPFRTIRPRRNGGT